MNRYSLNIVYSEFMERYVVHFCTYNGQFIDCISFPTRSQAEEFRANYYRQLYQIEESDNG